LKRLLAAESAVEVAVTEWTLEETVLITGHRWHRARGCRRDGARAHLVLVGRNQARGLDAISEIRRRAGSDRAEFLRADFSSLAEVRRLALAFAAEDRPLHVLVNNAGMMNTSRKLTVDGFEEMFAVNYLAHFLLTRLLLARLQECAPSRIVHVAPRAHCSQGALATSHERVFHFPRPTVTRNSRVSCFQRTRAALRGSGVT
jgi:NAD(P)-dependent dehydrogenase (short-subunit alcohol dehydrogenase family)